MDAWMVFSKWCVHSPNNAVLGPLESKSRTASRSVQSVLHRSRQSVPVLYNGPPSSPSLKIALSHGGCGPPSNTWFLGPTRVLNPNGISNAWAVFAGLITVTDRQTDRQTRPRCSVCNVRIYGDSVKHIYWALCTTGLLKLVITPQELLSCICVNVPIFSFVESRHPLILRFLSPVSHSIAINVRCFLSTRCTRMSFC